MLHEAGQLDPPNQRARNVLSAGVTLLVHAALLATIAMIPWNNFAEELPGDGTLVMIGKLPKSVLLETSEDQFDLEETLSPEFEQTFDSLDTQRFSPTITGELSDEALREMAFSPSGGGPKPFEFDSLNESDLLAGGTEDFADLVSRLNRDGLDIVITFDSTGSMGGEIEQVKNQISRIGTVLFDLIEKTRIGICTYRDDGDEYVVKGLPLTDNLTEVVLFLEKVSAAGGGDEPEAVERGLQWSTEQKFRRSARKVILLFGDAPPRPSQSVKCQSLAAEFRRTGGVVSTVTCRARRKMDEFVAIAELGNGEAFLTANEREIVTQLIVLVFGSKHRDKVIEAFDLLGETPSPKRRR